MHYLRASHFAPTVLVTALTFLFARDLFSMPEAAVIALTIFSGQLLVGWSNELVDYQSDLIQGRFEKPLVAGAITINRLRMATFTVLPICVGLSLFGPLGLRGGALHLLGVACGVSYNFYFKRTLLSPLPYAIAFAALPATPYLASGNPVPLWMVAVGGIFGVVAHFANVLKDLDSDQVIAIRGLPQRLSSTTNTAICVFFLWVAIAILCSHKPELTYFLVSITFIGSALIAIRPRKLAFPVIMALALFSVLALIY